MTTELNVRDFEACGYEVEKAIDLLDVTTDIIDNLYQYQLAYRNNPDHETATALAIEYAPSQERLTTLLEVAHDLLLNSQKENMRLVNAFIAQEKHGDK